MGEKISYEGTRSYKDVARRIGNSKACHAVGGAMHNNPLRILIPRHRVLDAEGSLKGYAGEMPSKKRSRNEKE